MLLISGLLLNTAVSWWLGYPWLEIIGFGLILLSLLISKKQITAVHEDYGIYIYYALLVSFMLIIFGKWFM